MQNLKATLLRRIQNWIQCTSFPQRWPRIKETEAFVSGNVFACYTWLSEVSEGAATVDSPVLSESNLRRSLWMETIIFGKYQDILTARCTSLCNACAMHRGLDCLSFPKVLVLKLLRGRGWSRFALMFPFGLGWRRQKVRWTMVRLVQKTSASGLNTNKDLQGF